MNLGWCDVCLDVKDIKEARAFYENLGFKAVEGSQEDNYFIMVNDSARVGLYQGCFEGFMLNFRGGDVMANAKQLKEKGLLVDSEAEESDGSVGATVIDPDGNIIYLNTHPSELNEEYQKKVAVL